MPGKRRRSATTGGSGARARSLRARDSYAAAVQAQSLGRLDHAESHYRKAIAAEPAFAEAHNNLGGILLAAGRHEEAEREFRAAFAGGLPEALANLGSMFLLRGHAEEAADAYANAIAKRPGKAQWHSDLARALSALGRVTEAMECMRRALQLEPTDLAGRVAYGRMLLRNGNERDAEDMLRGVLHADPQNAQASHTLSTLLLLEGRYLDGWPLWERRFDAVGKKAQAFPWAEWKGEDLGGRSLVVRPEQGFGDIIQFARYLPLLKLQYGIARLTVVVPPPLRRLFCRIGGIDEILSEGDQLLPHDYWVWIGSLPLRFATEESNIPGQQPYLSTDPSLAADWRVVLPQQWPRVGIVWAGAANTPGDQIRSLPSIDALTQLLGIPGVSFVSLQRDRQQEIGRSQIEVTSVGDRLSDFADAAAVIDALDMVVCVDTAYAHLAAAMGKPTLVLLGSNTEWRWMKDRADSPWYPTVTLFRQDLPGSWSAPVAAVAEAVARHFNLAPAARASEAQQARELV